MKKTCMITGANNLLGLALVEALQQDYQVIQIAHQTDVSSSIRGSGRSTTEKLYEVDLSDPAECRNLVAAHKPEILVHAAECSDLDFCEAKSSSKWLNVESTRMLAGALAPEGRFVLMSSDQVFGGDAGPYREMHERKPIHAYGRQKAAAEELAEARPNGMVIRTPKLIGREPEDQPGLLTGMLQAISDGEAGEVDDVCMQYPTWTGDVAEAVRFLLVQQASGIFHAAYPDGGTLYNLTHRLANFTGQSLTHKQPSTEIVRPRHGARRPVNNQLLSQNLLKLGFPGFHSFTDTLALLADHGCLPGMLTEH
ncbi:MAG: dTDP-4-dehydrorhamnose reductase [Candidatus Omnitrophota bacterium]|jgi:dTDP-4-dehydrorhamnose reductase